MKKSILFLLGALILIFSCVPDDGGSGGDSDRPANWPLTGDLGVHDPAIIKEGNTWYIFGTGVGIEVKRSSDGYAWRNIGRVFSTYPSWARQYVPNHESNIWAPDIRYHNGTYYLFYSISSFGSNTSAIGLATTTSLSSPNWLDKGLVIRSTSSSNYNCIDPNMVVDASGRVWLALLERSEADRTRPNHHEAQIGRTASLPGHPRRHGH